MKTLIFVFILFGLAKVAMAQQCVIKANVSGFKDGTKFYLHDLAADTDIDSTVIRGNVFELRTKLVSQPQNLWVTASAEGKFYYFTLLLGNEQVNVKGDASDFPWDLRITGSEIQNIHNEHISLTKSFDKQRDLLLKEYFALKGDSAKIKSKIIWESIAKIDSTRDVVSQKFVKSHLNTYEGVSNLFYLNNKLPKDTLQMMYNSLKPEFKQSVFGKRVATYLKIGSILKQGDLVSDFEGLDINGVKHRLSAIKSKYILLDFSTTYCGPCIGSMEDLRKLKTSYADKLTIVTFSGDASKLTWTKGLIRDKPDWLSLWDGQGYFGETIQKYGVNGFPTFVLIDEGGKIISKWSGYGKEDNGKGSLETKVEQLISNKL